MNAKAANIITKAVGAVGAGFVLYDVNKAGVMESQMTIKNGIAGRLPKAYNQSRKQDSMSHVASNVNDYIFKEKVSFSLRDKLNAVKGYAVGGAEQLVAHVVPAALAAGALIKNRLSKACAIGLGVWTGYQLICSAFNIGKIKHFRD